MITRYFNMKTGEYELRIRLWNGKWMEYLPFKESSDRILCRNFRHAAELLRKKLKQKGIL